MKINFQESVKQNYFEPNNREIKMKLPAVCGEEYNSGDPSTTLGISSTK